MPPSKAPATPCSSRGGPLRLGLLGAVLLAVAPGAAQAQSIADRLEFHMYGRMGIGWTPVAGDVIMGRSLNLTGNSLGGRLEEGDYLEPTIKFHIIKPENDSAPYARVVLTPSVFSRQPFLGFFSNSYQNAAQLEIFQAYAEGGNFLIPDLKMWAGQRFYRGSDIHIADYYYFNNLSSQGGGIIYKALDLAILMQTGNVNDRQYGYDSNGDGTPDSTRQRTIFVAQYVQPLFGKSTLQGLAEFHLLPAARKPGQPEIKPADDGWVLGAKFHYEGDNGNFNDVSLRYGGGIANGTLGGAQTFSTFGAPDLSGRYSTGGALGLEFVEHFVWNASQMFSLNGYATVHYAKGGSGTAGDSGLDGTVGFRGFVYLTNNFHLVEEAHFQVRQIGAADLGTMLRLSIVPTFVPTGERSVWARPHLRAFYTIAFYNKAAQDQAMTPYMQALGASAIAHYIGARAEWWF